MTDHRAELISARRQLGLSVAEMARRLETPRNTYKQWESGARRTPGVAVVAARMMAAPRPDKTAISIDWDAEIDLAGKLGETLPQMARRLGISKYLARRAMERRGRSLRIGRARRGDIDWDAEIARAAASGETAPELAIRLGVVRTLPYLYARRRGVKLRPARRNAPSAEPARTG